MVLYCAVHGIVVLFGAVYGVVWYCIVLGVVLCMGLYSAVDGVVWCCVWD